MKSRLLVGMIFGAGPLSAADLLPVSDAVMRRAWKAQWIACPDAPDRDAGVYRFRKTVRIEPQLGALDRLNAALPHPRGEITVAYRRLGSEFGASVALPPGLTGELVWRGKTYPLASGGQELKLPAR